MPKIINDGRFKNSKSNKRGKIKNALLLSGGGTNQTLFSCGAVKCIVDNGLFDFELISGISGGTLLLTILDLCTSPLFNYYKEHDWYNRYVRKNVYASVDCEFVPTIIKNLFTPTQAGEYLFKSLPDFDKPMGTENTNVICEYNYVDINRNMMSNDHTDIIDLPNKIKEPYWFFIRPVRCTMPFTNFYNRPTSDGGFISDVPVNSVFSRHDIQNVFIVHACPPFEYDTYAPNVKPGFNVYMSLYLSANNSLQDMIALSTQSCSTVVYCSMSNGLTLSEDKIHKGLFDEWRRDCPFLVWMFNGLIFNNKPLMKVIENEGYIQMYYQLKQAYPKKKLVFDIPNPDVYNSNVKEIIRDAVSRNSGYEFIKAVAKAKFLRL
jgi:hypothetical protein